MSLFAFLGLGWIWNIVIIVAAIMAVVYFVGGRKAGRSLWFWGQSQVGEAVRSVTDTGIIAQLNQAVTNGTAKIEAGRTGLARIGGMRRSLQSQVKTCAEEEQRLINRIKVAKASGDPNNTITGYAEQLATVREELSVNRAQLTELERQYDEYASDVREGDRAVKDAQLRALSLKARLEMSEAQRQMADFANGFNPNAVTGEVVEAMKRVEDRINENLGAADASGVGREQRSAERKDRELDRKARVADILAEFDATPAAAGTGANGIPPTGQ